MVGDLQPNEYRYGENVLVREGDAITRPGVRRAWPLPPGFRRGFFFNEENARVNDATHTGFWFPFYFFGELWRTIQGVEWYRFNDETEFSQLIVNDGTVYKHQRGLVKAIKTAKEIQKTEDIEFIQGNNQIIMLRSGGGEPMYWDGADKTAGFKTFTSAGTSNRIPKAAMGSYMFGRLWLINDRHDVYASDSLDFDTYDYVDQLFSVNRGDKDEIVKILPYRENYAFVFKKNATYALSGVNSYVPEGEKLSSYISVETISPDKGMVGPHAYALHGEQITFLSYSGITSVARSTQGKLMGKDVTLSESIQPLIDRINWDYAHKACGTYYQNYLLFAVPLDTSVVNSHILVYDLTAKNGKGAWVSVWKSDMITPLRFFVEKEKLFFLNSDGAVKIMWSDDPWDTENVFDDVPIWNAADSFETGDLRYWAVGEEDRVYRALQDGGGQEVTDTDYFERVTELAPEVVYPIESELRLRFLYHQDEVVPKRYGRCQIVFSHQNPKVDVQLESEDYGTRADVFSDQEYSQVAYDIAGTDDWVPTNISLDFHNPHRQDYTPFIYHNYGFYTVQDYIDYGFTAQDLINLGIPASGAISGIFIDSSGWAINIEETHSLRFIPTILNNNAISLIIKNTQGRIALKSAVLIAQESQFAGKDR